jgi:hypothetical protein
MIGLILNLDIDLIFMPRGQSDVTVDNDSYCKTPSNSLFIDQKKSFSERTTLSSSNKCSSISSKRMHLELSNVPVVVDWSALITTERCDSSILNNLCFRCKVLMEELELNSFPANKDNKTAFDQAMPLFISRLIILLNNIAGRMDQNDFKILILDYDDFISSLVRKVVQQFVPTSLYVYLPQILQSINHLSEYMEIM